MHGALADASPADFWRLLQELDLEGASVEKTRAEAVADRISAYTKGSGKVGALAELFNPLYWTEGLWQEDFRAELVAVQLAVRDDLEASREVLEKSLHQVEDSQSLFAATLAMHPAGRKLVEGLKQKAKR
eukprot:1197203-Amphidinium_carterae.1